ncbi:MAG: cyclic nucleotide-binding domain-containing protein [Desulfocapsaceae bacterium]|nr:cyclic nucleotide-binding domain-containing protein [Desulfocapsaceae bacterium]
MGETERLTTQTYQKGEVIFHEGDPGEHVYLIINGSVQIFKTVGDKRQLLNTIGSGEIFGEMGLVSNEPRFATVVAAEDCRLIKVQDKAFHMALVNEKMPIIKPLIMQLVERFRNVEIQNHEYLKRINHLENELSYAREKLLDHELSKSD